MKLPIVIPSDVGATPIDAAVLENLIGPDAIAAGELRFKFTHFGPWHICTSITGLAISGGIRGEIGRPREPLTIYGLRTAHGITQPGAWSEGRVSVGGRKRTCFTSSTLFELPGGKLVEVAVLHLHSSQV